MKHELFVLTADGAQKQAIAAILQRPEALGIRRIQFDAERDIKTHPQHDLGIMLNGPELASLQIRGYQRLLLVADLEGSGQEAAGATLLETRLEQTCIKMGWPSQVAAAVIIEPEIEQWVWSSSPHVEAVLGWTRSEPVREWLGKRGFEVDPENSKPLRPKEAMHAVLRECRVQISSALFARLGGVVSFKRCRDRSFCKLVKVLQEWFPCA
jgi:hypothetical protein